MRAVKITFYKNASLISFIHCAQYITSIIVILVIENDICVSTSLNAVSS